jgi:nitroimidazol reductase NimA-like FMN-containing flavoprotein (pyridoxamine 5'-phosphate oxidase superfamily)
LEWWPVPYEQEGLNTDFHEQNQQVSFRCAELAGCQVGDCSFHPELAEASRAAQGRKLIVTLRCFLN